MCSLCRRVDVADINAAIASGRSFRDISRQFHVSKDVIFRHAQHVPAKVAHAAQARQQAQSIDLLAKLDELETLCRTALGWTAKNQDARALFAGIGRLLDILTFYRELQVASVDIGGELERHDKLRRELAADRARLDRAIIESLTPFPEAHLALAEALDRLEHPGETVA